MEIPDACKVCWIDTETSCNDEQRKKCQEDYEGEGIWDE